MSSINEDLKLKILKGDPILLEKTNCFFIHRTISEIIDYSYTNFLRAIQLFLLPDEEIAKDMPVPGMSTFLYFLIILNNNEGDFPTLLRQGFNFFIGAENISVNMEEKKLLFDYKEVKNIELSEEGFKEIIKYIEIIYNGSFLQEEQDLSEAERRMKEKFDRLRREREAAKKESSNVAFSDMLGGFAVRNYNYSWDNMLKLPYYTFFFLLKKLRNYDDYDLQLKARLAGADIKEELHHWLSGDDEE